jgi:uncharacterized membrane protein YkoI
VRTLRYLNNYGACRKEMEMTTKRRWYAGIAVGVLGAVVAGALLLTTGASAGKGGVLDDGKDLLPQANITLEQAIAAAQASTPGALDEVDLEYYNGKLVFNVDVGDQDVKVDAATGKVIGADSEEPANQ